MAAVKQSDIVLEVAQQDRGSGLVNRLCVHPQTVRYRMRKLERTLGGQLDDPDARFAMELVLRATRLRERASPPG